MNENIVRGWSIVTCGCNESKSLSVGEPFDVSLDFFCHGCQLASSTVVFVLGEDGDYTMTRDRPRGRLSFGDKPGEIYKKGVE